MSESNLQTNISYGVAAAATAFFLSTKPWERKEEVKKRVHVQGQGEMTITRLMVYPVKSMGAYVVNEWDIEPQGLLYDRRWMVIREEPNGKGFHRKVSQREHPVMATITPDLVLDENKKLKGLTLYKKDFEPLVVPNVDEKGDHKTYKVDIWDDIIDGAIDLGDECAQWCSNVIGIKCRLVFAPDTLSRGVFEKEFISHLKEEDFHNKCWFPDGYPYLLLTEELVEWCNKDCLRTDDTEIKANRFRPNILIAGSSSPMALDTWRRIMICHSGNDSGVVMDCVKPCTRCSMPSINQETGTRTKQPRPWLEENRMSMVGDSFQSCFGVNAVQLKKESAPGANRLRVGDQLVVLSRGEGLKEKQ